MLERPWLNKHKLIGSTYHQCVKGQLDQNVIRIFANSTPFDETETHYVDCQYYDKYAEDEAITILTRWDFASSMGRNKRSR